MSPVHLDFRYGERSHASLLVIPAKAGMLFSSRTDCPEMLHLLYSVESSRPPDPRHAPDNGICESLNQSDAAHAQRRSLLTPFMVRQTHHERNQLVQSFPNGWIPAFAGMTSINTAGFVDA